MRPRITGNCDERHPGKLHGVEPCRAPLHIRCISVLEVVGVALKHAELQRKEFGRAKEFGVPVCVVVVPLLLHLIYQRGVKPGVSIELKNFLEDLQVAVVHFDA